MASPEVRLLRLAATPAVHSTRTVIRMRGGRVLSASAASPSIWTERRNEGGAMAGVLELGAAVVSFKSLEARVSPMRWRVSNIS